MTTYAYQGPALHEVLDSADGQGTVSDNSGSYYLDEEELSESTGTDSPTPSFAGNFEEEDRDAVEGDGEDAKAIGADERPKEPLGILLDSWRSKPARQHNWALVRFTDVETTQLAAPPHSYPSNKRCEGATRHLDPEGNPVDVILILPDASHEGLLEFCPCSGWLGNAPEPARLRSISFPNRHMIPKHNGGAWVVQEFNDSFQVLGHLVASDPSGDLYMIPMETVLEDIKESMGAEKVEVCGWTKSPE